MVSTLDIDGLLRPVSDESPGGANLEYSAEYAEVERAAAGRPERQVGDVIDAAQEPEWESVAERAAAILRASKDLRVATLLARALLATRGHAGLADGLAVLRGLVERHWPSLHPAIDEDDGDATSRANAVAALSHRDFVQALRAAPLATSREGARIALRDLEAAGGTSGGPSADALRRALPEASLRGALEALQASAGHASALAQAWAAHASQGAPDFAELRKALEKARAVVAAAMPEGTAASTNGTPSPLALSSSAAGASASAPSFGGPLALRSREDVVATLDALCAYYARHEPASPVRPLLERCKRLVPMSFLDVVRELCPDALPSVQTITGQQ